MPVLGAEVGGNPGYVGGLRTCCACQIRGSERSAPVRASPAGAARVAEQQHGVGPLPPAGRVLDAAVHARAADLHDRCDASDLRAIRFMPGILPEIPSSLGNA